MDKRIKTLLWAGLFLCLALSYGGWRLRTGMEAVNKNVITAVDYRELWKTASNANADMGITLDRLQEQGVRYIGVKETTLRDLAFQGDLNIQNYGDFRSFNQVYAPAVWERACQAMAFNKINPDRVSPSCLVLVVGKPGMVDFLNQRLGDRYDPEQVIAFKNGADHYFLLNAELTQMDKRKEAKQELDATLGFDPRILKDLNKRGFFIILRPENNKGPNLSYLNEYEGFIRQYGVKYLLFSNEVSGNPDHLAKMEELVGKYHLIVGVIETPEQIMCMDQPGLNTLIAATGYPVNRVYSTTNDDFVQTVSERYYRWVRAVIDRGIRILYVSPFKDAKQDASVNLNNTIETIGKFHQTIGDKGFIVNRDLKRLPDRTNPPWQQFMVSLSLLAAGLLYLVYLFRLSRRNLLVLLGVGTALLAVLNLLLPLDLSKVYALGAAILYPSFSSLLLLLYLRDSRRGLTIKLTTGLAIIVAVNMIGAYTVISSLSDIRYVMNLKDFSGVKVAFLTPLLLFALNYFSCFAGQQSVADRIWKALQMKPSYLVLILFVLAAAGGYYYLGRSGNNVVQVSGLEIKTREILEGLFPARPRFKEILIGYPALMAAVYLYHKYRREVILLILGFGVVMGSISMVNSFCHVFTAASISINRTLGGLVLGMAVGLITIVVIRLLELAVGRWLPGIGEQQQTEKFLN